MAGKGRGNRSEYGRDPCGNRRGDEAAGSDVLVVQNVEHKEFGSEILGRRTPYRVVSIALGSFG